MLGRKIRRRAGWLRLVVTSVRWKWRLLDTIDDLRVKNRLMQDEKADLQMQCTVLREMVDSLQVENRLRGMIATADLDAVTSGKTRS